MGAARIERLSGQPAVDLLSGVELTANAVRLRLLNR